jgi:hypothetical protein
MAKRKTMGEQAIERTRDLALEATLDRLMRRG